MRVAQHGATRMIAVNLALLAPAAALAAWSLVVLFWMMATRGPAMRASGIRLGRVEPGLRGQALDGVLPDRTNWKAHNYTHLMEQPTLFYALAIILALAGGGTPDAILAWSYTGLRVVHSLWQGLVNTLPVRVVLFGMGTLVLTALAVRALMLTLG